MYLLHCQLTSIKFEKTLLTLVLIKHTWYHIEINIYSIAHYYFRCQQAERYRYHPQQLKSSILKLQLNCADELLIHVYSKFFPPPIYYIVLLIFKAISTYRFFCFDDVKVKPQQGKEK